MKCNFQSALHHMIFVYVYWCPTRCPCQMMFVSLNSNMTDVNSWAETGNLSGASDFTFTYISIVWAVHLTFGQITCICIFSSVWWGTLRFPRKYNVKHVFVLIWLVVSSCFVNVICIYLRVLVSNAISISDNVCAV